MPTRTVVLALRRDFYEGGVAIESPSHRLPIADWPNRSPSIKEAIVSSADEVEQAANRLCKGRPNDSFLVFVGYLDTTPVMVLGSRNEAENWLSEGAI